MIQLVVNVNLLREIDERKLINAYARLCYWDKSDISDDIKIQNNLISILDWDKRGSRGLGIYCGKYETIKRKDWSILIQFIKDNGLEIRNISYKFKKKRRAEELKEIISEIDLRKEKAKERLSDKNYEVSNRGIPARGCYFEGRYYKSRSECIIKEGISNYKLYKYLKETNQL